MSSVEVKEAHEMYNNLIDLDKYSVWPPFKLSIFCMDGTSAVIECTGCNEMKCGDYDVTYENRDTSVILTWNNNTLWCSQSQSQLNETDVTKMVFEVSTGQFDDCDLNKCIYNSKYDSTYPVNTTNDAAVNQYGDLRVPTAKIVNFPESVLLAHKSRWYSIGKCGAVVMVEFVPQKSGNPRGTFYWLTDTGDSRVCFPISVDLQVREFYSAGVLFSTGVSLYVNSLIVTTGFPLYMVTMTYLGSCGGRIQDFKFLPSAYRTTTRITSALSFQLTRQ